MSDISALQATTTFRELSARNPNVEVWADHEFTLGGHSYFWIVSKDEDNVKLLAYVRRRSGEFQKRTYDQSGDDLWVDVK